MTCDVDRRGDKDKTFWVIAQDVSTEDLLAELRHRPGRAAGLPGGRADQPAPGPAARGGRTEPDRSLQARWRLPDAGKRGKLA
jgi:hypothetical protein